MIYFWVFMCGILIGILTLRWFINDEIKKAKEITKSIITLIERIVIESIMTEVSKKTSKKCSKIDKGSRDEK